MELSELTAQLQSNGVKISVKPSYKTYYSIFPHVVRFTNDGKRFESVRPVQIKIKESIYDKVDQSQFKVRREYYDMNIYCMDPVKILEAVSLGLLKRVEINVEEMEQKVLDHATVKPNLPRAVTKVVKKLPWEGYRYRVHWNRNWRVMHYQIGKETFASIIDHINNDPNSRHFDHNTTENLKNFRFWGSSYFYTNDENIFTIISLINPLFIKKIEKFITLEEVNEQTTS